MSIFELLAYWNMELSEVDNYYQYGDALVHKTAIIGHNNELGRGVLIKSDAIIDNNSKIGKYSQINEKVIIKNNTIVKENSQIKN